MLFSHDILRINVLQISTFRLKEYSKKIAKSTNCLYAKALKKKRRENFKTIGQQSQNRILVGNVFRQYEESCQDHFIKIFLSHIIRAAPTPNQLWRITIKTFPRKQWLPVVIQSRLRDSVKNFIFHTWNTTGDPILYHIENNDK